MDSDRILVMDAGRAIEFDAPAALMETEGSAFRSLATSMLAGRKKAAAFSSSVSSSS